MFDIKLFNLYQDTSSTERSELALMFSPDISIEFDHFKIGVEIDASCSPYVANFKTSGLPEDNSFVSVNFFFSVDGYSTEEEADPVFSIAASYRALLVADIMLTEELMLQHQGEITSKALDSVYPLAYTKWRDHVSRTSLESGVGVINLDIYPPKVLFEK